MNTLEKPKSTKRTITGLFLALTVILATTSVALSKRPFAVAATNPRIYVDPSEIVFDTTHTRVGDLFNVTIWVQDAPDIAGWSVYIQFDNNTIRATRWFEPVNDSQYIFYGGVPPKTTSANPTPPNPYSLPTRPPGGNNVLVGVNLFPGPPGQQPSSGSGKLCIFEFNITAAPTTGELSSALHINTDDTFLMDPDGYDVPDVTKEDGLFRFVYTTSIPPHLEVDPASTRFSPYQNVSGMAFNVSVLARAVDPALSLNSVSFSLAYDQSILATERSNVTFGSLWSGPNSTTVNGGMVNVTVYGPASTPSGVVPIAVIGFTVIQQNLSPPDSLGAYISTNLTLVDNRFQGSSGEITPDVPHNGTVNIYSYSSAQTPLSLDPIASSIRVTNDTKFNINVTIGDVFDLHSIKLRIFYDTNIINFSTNYVDRVEASSYFSDQAGTVDIVNSVNWTAGYLDINATVPPEVPTPIPVGSGNLFTVSFLGIASGTMTMNFSEPYAVDTLLVDSFGVTIPVEYRQKGLHADFSYSPSKPTMIDSVKFVDKSVSFDGYITSWSWNFSDGLTATTQNLTHSFAQTGSYLVTLTVIDNNTATSSITKTVTVFNAPPIVNFTYSPLYPRPNDDIYFADNSVDPENMSLTSWFWDFGDGANSTEQNPSHKFVSAGNYTVTLTVADDQNLKALISAEISVTEPAGFDPTWIIVIVIVVIIAVVVVVLRFIGKRRATIPT